MSDQTGGAGVPDCYLDLEVASQCCWRCPGPLPGSVFLACSVAVECPVNPLRRSGGDVF